MPELSDAKKNTRPDVMKEFGQKMMSCILVLLAGSVKEKPDGRHEPDFQV